jgi:hypothetical protein
MARVIAMPTRCAAERSIRCIFHPRLPMIKAMARISGRDPRSSMLQQKVAGTIREIIRKIKTRFPKRSCSAKKL